jgi:hypothetical protein
MFSETECREAAPKLARDELSLSSDYGVSLCSAEYEPGIPSPTPWSEHNAQVSIHQVASVCAAFLQPRTWRLQVEYCGTVDWSSAHSPCGRIKIDIVGIARGA